MKKLLLWASVVAGLVAVAALLVQRQSERQAAAQLASAPVVAPLALVADDFVQVRAQPLGRTVPVSGGLKALDSAFVKAKVAAELRTLTVREGDAVRAGQVIGELDPLEFELRLQQAERTADGTKAQWDIAVRNLANSRSLVAQGFISETALLTSQTAEQAARAQHEAAVAGVDLARKARADARLVAPISGRVSQRLVQPGERVAVDGRIVEIVDLSSFELEAALAPEDAAGVREGQRAQLQIEGAGSGAAFGARVHRIAPATQAGSRAVIAYLRLDATRETELRQGLFVRGRIEQDQRQALAVPADSVNTDSGRATVRTVQNGRVAVQVVQLGPTELAQWGSTAEPAHEVLQGLEAGAVVLRGRVGAVREGAAVTLPK